MSTSSIRSCVRGTTARNVNEAKTFTMCLTQHALARPFPKSIDQFTLGKSNSTDLIIPTPEMLGTPHFISVLTSNTLTEVVIDGAHKCGHSVEWHDA